jgi:two-component system response regulator FixJ
MTAPAPVYVLEDDAAVRGSLKLLLDVAGFSPVVFRNAEELLARLPLPRRGCLVADVRLPGMSGLKLHKELLRRGMALPVIFISGHADLSMAIAALRQGAFDFLEKPIDDEALIACISAALARTAGASEPAADPALAARLGRLTAREREVLELVVAGYTSRAIGERLGVSARTVENHRARVMEKMQATSTAQLVRMALAADRNLGGSI